jgi:hypothetical protein
VGSPTSPRFVSAARSRSGGGATGACIRRGLLLAALLMLAGGPLLYAARAQAPPPGAPASEATVRELQQALADATVRFEAMDAAGVLVHVSPRYRSGPFTKVFIRDQLLAMFTLYDRVRAKVRLDDVRLVNGDAWIYSTGEVSGRLRGIGAWTTVLTWEREPEIARREQNAWRLTGLGP